MSLITPLRHVGPLVRLWHVATSDGWARASAARCYVLRAPFALRDLAEAVGRLPVIGAPVASYTHYVGARFGTCFAWLPRSDAEFRGRLLGPGDFSLPLAG